MNVDTLEAPGIADEVVEGALRRAWRALDEFGGVTRRDGGLFGYFAALGGVLGDFDGNDLDGVAVNVLVHIRYLAERAGSVPASVLRGEPFSADPAVIADTLINVSAELGMASRMLDERARAGGLPHDVFAVIEAAEQRLEGWCTRQKSTVIARMVMRERPLVCVEIGIFGGRSLVPCAAALRHNGAGAIYGIEAWSPEVAKENSADEENNRWWSEVDFPRIKRAFYGFVAEQNLTEQVRVVEAASGRAAALFDSIDFLHIDGSHSALNAAEDVLLYARKVRPGGIVIFDDIDWQSTNIGFSLLEMLCDTVDMLKEPSTGKELCAVMRRR